MPVPSDSQEAESKEVKPDRISRNSFWILVGQTGAAALSFVTVFAMTRYLGPEQYGLFSTALSLALLLIPLADFGFDLHMTRTISSSPASLKSELSHTLSAKIILSAIVWCLMVSCAVLLRYQAQVIEYVALLGLSVVIGSLAQSFVGTIRAIRKMRYEAMAFIAGRLTTMVSVIMMILMKARLSEIILAYLLGSAALILVAFILLKSQVGALDLRFGLNGIDQRFARALPFGLTVIFTTIYFKADTIIISKFHDPAQVGYYNGAQNIIAASMMLATPLVVAMFPALAAVFPARKEEAETIFERGLVFVLLLGIPLGVGTALMSKSVVSLAYGVRFLPAAVLLLIMAAKIPLVFSTLLLGNSLGALGFQGKVARVAGINAFFSVAMNLILIPAYGAIAAAAITVLTELSGLIQLAVITRKILSIKVAPHVVRICLCCLLGTLGFVVVNGVFGNWPAALTFALIYVGSIFLLKLITVGTLRDMLISRNLG